VARVHALSRDEKLARLRDPTRRALRHAVEHPNRDADAGSTLPPPRWEVVFVDEVADPRHARSCGRTIAEIAAEQGVAPADAMLDLALAENLATRFRFENRHARVGAGGAREHEAPVDPDRVSDGGAHLDRDDGAEWSSYFLRFWVLDRGEWTLEEGSASSRRCRARSRASPTAGALCRLRRRPVRVRSRSIGPRASGACDDLPAASAFFARRTGSRDDRERRADRARRQAHRRMPARS
jgi:hypothetical protein